MKIPSIKPPLPSLLFGGNARGRVGIASESNTVTTISPFDFPSTTFRPLVKSNNSPLVFASKDGKAQQWSIVAQSSFADIAADRYNGLVIEQQFNGALSYIGCGVDITSGQPLVSAIGTPTGLVARVGSVFRAFGDRIRIFPYVNAFSPTTGKLSIGSAQEDLMPFTQNVFAGGVGALIPVPYFSTHVSVHGFLGDLLILDAAAITIATIVAPVDGTYHPLPPNAATISDSIAGASDRVVSWRIFG